MFGDLLALLKLKQYKFFCSNSIILITLVILKENLGTLLWRMLLQHIGKFQTTASNPPLDVRNIVENGMGSMDTELIDTPKP